MPTTTVAGLEVYYETHGSGPPLLMFAPGGFDATIEKWRVASAWTGINALEALAAEHTLIVYDRRESGRSGGRVEKLIWPLYARQGKELLDHLGIGAATIMGGCMGCSVALAFAVAYPEATAALVLHWPVGGYRWKATGLERFQRHWGFAKDHGLGAVVQRARTGKNFWSDPEAGPWASVIDRDPAFAERFAAQNPDRYLAIVMTSGRALFDRDTATGAEPEELAGIDAPALIIPGDDPSHATSGAHYLRECLRRAEFWNVMPPEQNTQKVCDRILEFCRAHA
ncbi:MAG TPA: alpha/beta hydrolase [Candidatus Eisenbacteria bacterium]|nr:alpha/beta hydrolase [Candidatus Eisenbacteria bacterium]